MTEANRHICCGCGIKPPQSSTTEAESSTLLSARFGWRVVRRSAETGGTQVEWRCPACWEIYKAGRTSIHPEPSRRRA